MSNEIIGIRKAVKPAETNQTEQIESNQESSYKLNRPARIEPKEETPPKEEQKPYTPIRPKRFETKKEITTKQYSKTPFPQKPSRSSKPQKLDSFIERIPEATNAKGELFKPGDKILVLSPWCQEVKGEITGFYKGAKGSIFAEFVPQESLPQWSWEKGCIRAELLKLV